MQGCLLGGSDRNLVEVKGVRGSNPLGGAAGGELHRDGHGNVKS